MKGILHMFDQSICKMCVRKEWTEHCKNSDWNWHNYFEHWWAANWNRFELCPCILVASSFERYKGFAGDFGMLLEDSPPEECPYILEQVISIGEMEQQQPAYVFDEEKAKNFHWPEKLIEMRRKNGNPKQ